MRLIAKYGLASVSAIAAAHLAVYGAAAREAGVAAAVNADSLTFPPQQQERTLVVGHNVVFDEKITTGDQGQAQLLMLDQSAVTVAPNSELIIDKFVYDPDKRTGEMALSLSRGLMRFVGGRISKGQQGVQVRTPVATMGIRGGVGIFNVISEDTVEVTLLFGEGIEGETNTGEPFTVRRHGYFTRIESGKPSPPQPAPGQTIGDNLKRLEGRQSASAGAPEKPTEEGANRKLGDAPPPVDDARPTNDTTNARIRNPEEEEEEQIAEIVSDDVDEGDDDENNDNDGEDTATEGNDDLDGDGVNDEEQIVDDNDDDPGDDDPVDTGNQIVQNNNLNANGVVQGGQALAANFFDVTVVGDNNDDTINETVVDTAVTNIDSLAVVGAGTGNFDPNNFNDGDQFFIVAAANGDTLAAQKQPNGGGLEFSLNGIGDPNAVQNIFDANDNNTYVSAFTFNEGGVPQALRAQNDSANDWFFSTLRTQNFDGVNGDSITLFGGAGSTGGFANDRGFYDIAGDDQTISLLPFSEIGRFEIDIGGPAGVINRANVQQTPLMVDTETDKVLLLGGVFQNVDGGGMTGGGDTVYGFQVLTGEGSNGEGGPIIVGSNVGSTHYEKEGQETRLFHAGGIGNTAPSTFVGNTVGDRALFLQGDHHTIAPDDGEGTAVNPVTTNNLHLGTETTDPGIDARGTGVSTETLFAAAHIVNADGDLERLVTDPNSEAAGVGQMVIDRGQMTVDVTLNVTSNEGDGVTLTNTQGTGVFFDDKHFGVAEAREGTNGFQNGTEIAFGMASNVVIPDAMKTCKCEFLHWGVWAAGQFEDGAPSNSMSDVGYFFAGVQTPTVDMPVTGTAIYNGDAYASVVEAGADSPVNKFGAFQHEFNFGTGVGVGTLNLGNENFNSISTQTVGQSAYEMQYTQAGGIVGGGDGIFTGAGAANTAATLNIARPDGYSATGIVIGER